MNKDELKTLEYAISIVHNQATFNRSIQHQGCTERCVEVPWIADRIISIGIKSLLDVGFTMSSHDYLGLLLELVENGISLVGVDIVEPSRVITRYPNEWLKRIFSIPIHIQSFLNLNIDKKFDAITLVSTIEHIGFDSASHNNIHSAFNRFHNLSDIQLNRDEQTEHNILSKCFELLNDDGHVFITVPVGAGGPVPIRDSLGFFSTQWEYNNDSISKFLCDERFQVIETLLYKQTNNAQWNQLSSLDQCTDVTSALQDHAYAVALIHLNKVKKK